MSRFTLEPTSPNFPGPGKRMQHNMSPTILLRDGRLAGAVGLPGGRMIVTVTAQLVASVVDFKASAEKAVNAPRLHTEGAEPLTLSSNAPAALAAGLETRGHKLKRAGVAGAANAAIVNHQTGKIDFASGRKLDNPSPPPKS
jgi:gamma-glutamyltranspeptidase/glutathione hydrolase